MTDDALVFE